MSTQNPFAVPETFGDIASDVGSGRTYGGIRRLPYFGYSVANSLISNVLSFAVAAGGIAEAALGIAILSFVVTIFVGVKRLENLGYSGWWILGLLVPLLNILVAMRMLAAPEGYADHKTLDGPAKAIIGVIIGLIVLVIGIFVVAV